MSCVCDDHCVVYCIYLKDVSFVTFCRIYILARVFIKRQKLKVNNIIIYSMYINNADYNKI